MKYNPGITIKDEYRFFMTTYRAKIKSHIYFLGELATVFNMSDSEMQEYKYHLTHLDNYCSLFNAILGRKLSTKEFTKIFQ